MNEVRPAERRRIWESLVGAFRTSRAVWLPGVRRGLVVPAAISMAVILVTSCGSSTVTATGVTVSSPTGPPGSAAAALTDSQWMESVSQACHEFYTAGSKLPVSDRVTYQEGIADLRDQFIEKLETSNPSGSRVAWLAKLLGLLRAQSRLDHLAYAGTPDTSGPYPTFDMKADFGVDCFTP